MHDGHANFILKKFRFPEHSQNRACGCYTCRSWSPLSRTLGFSYAHYQPKKAELWAKMRRQTLEAVANEPILQLFGPSAASEKAFRPYFAAQICKCTSQKILAVRFNISNNCFRSISQHEFLYCRIRPYSVEYTRSRSISEVKQLQAGLVLGWVTAW